MTASTLRSVLLWLLPASALCAPGAADLMLRQDAPAREEPAHEPRAMHIHYLEIVTPDVDATCRALAKLHGVEFGEPRAELGNARTAPLAGGGTIGVRAPLRPDEEPVVRPYVLVDDIEAAVAAATTTGGEIALPPMEIPGRGRCAIFFQGGIEHGLWEE